jgi:hypothetical protein
MSFLSWLGFGYPNEKRFPLASLGERGKWQVILGERGI